MSNSQQAAAVAVNPATFVDLRQFAKDQRLGIPLAASKGDDRFLSSRRVLDWAPDSPVAAGAIALSAGSGSVPSLPADEFIIVCEGALTLTQQGRSQKLEQGNSVVLQQGAAFSWSAEAPVSLIFMRYNASQPGDQKIVPISETPPLSPSNPPRDELLLSPVPACRSYADYRSADAKFSCGTWDSTPYHRSEMYYPHCELMYLLEGSVTFIDETGRSGTFSKGDIFLVEREARCSWESREIVAKVFAIYRPA
jgi:uncharacterized cupin superfamily protein